MSTPLFGRLFPIADLKDTFCLSLQTPEQVGDEIWRAVAHRKKEVSVGLPFQLLNTMYKTFNINPLSVGV